MLVLKIVKENEALGISPSLPKLLLLFEPKTPSSAVQKEPQILTTETELLELCY